MSAPDPDNFNPQGAVSADELNARREAEAKKEMVLKQILDPQARLRLNNVRMVKPDLARAVENYLIGIGMQGKLQAPMTDDQLKQILLSAQQPKRDFRFNRI